jgi:hypothetical protein
MDRTRTPLGKDAAVPAADAAFSLRGQSQKITNLFKWIEEA